MDAIPPLSFEIPTSDGRLAVSVQRGTLKPVARGGVSSVFCYEAPDARRFAIKLFNRPDQVPWDKLAVLEGQANAEDAAGRYYQIAWPVSTVLSARRRVGCVLPFFETKGWVPLDHWIEFHLLGRLCAASASLTFRLRILRNCAAALADLHGRGMAVVDLKPSNILAHAMLCEVGFIDVDSYRVARDGVIYPATHVSAGYILPSALADVIDIAALDQEQDRYAFAVIVFQMLNFGIHPFQGILVAADDEATTNDEKAKRRLYPYSRAVSSKIRPLPQSVHACWPDMLRGLLDAAFVPGDRLPTARVWVEYLDSLLRDRQLDRCADHPDDARHIRFQGLPCMACARSRAAGAVRDRQMRAAPPAPARPAPPVPAPARRAAATPRRRSRVGRRLFLLAAGMLGFVLVRTVVDRWHAPLDLPSSTARPSPLPPSPPAGRPPPTATVMPLGANAWLAPPVPDQARPGTSGLFTGGTVVTMLDRQTDPDGWDWVKAIGPGQGSDIITGYVRADLLAGPTLPAASAARCATAYQTAWGPTPVYRTSAMIAMRAPAETREDLILFRLEPGKVYILAHSVRAPTGWEWHAIFFDNNTNGVVRPDHVRPAHGPVQRDGHLVCE